MVKKEFLLNQMSRLELNYGKERFKVTQDIFDLWYEMFENCNERMLKQAVSKCIKENEFAPNIAGLMKYYKEIEDAHNELLDTINSKYRTIRSIWEEPFDEDTAKEIYAYVIRFPEKTRKTEMIELAHKAISFRYDCSACGRTEIPTIREYVMGKR